MKKSKYIQLSISLFVAGLLVLPGVTHAKEKEDVKLVQNSDMSIATSSDASSVSIASTTPPADPALVASTTPTSVSTIPPATEVTPGDPYDPSIESTLNATLPPKIVPASQAPTPKAKTKSTRVASTTSTKIASTTVSGSTKNSTTNTSGTSISVTGAAESSQLAASDYYTPLDNLSPEVTYALSFLSMAFGIIGAVFILRNPREKEAWLPGLATQESLLKP